MANSDQVELVFLPLGGVGEIGGTIGFILIALVWFYLVSLSLMAGAVINALRYELHDTGTMRLSNGG